MYVVIVFKNVRRFTLNYNKTDDSRDVNNKQCQNKCHPIGTRHKPSVWDWQSVLSKSTNLWCVCR